VKKFYFIAGWVLFGLIAGLPYAASAADELPLKVGEIEIYPAVQIEEKHDDNIFAQENMKTGSWITIIDPAVKVVAEKGANSYEASYRLSKGIYHGSRTDDFIDHFADFTASFGPTSRLDIKTWARHSRTHDDRGSTFTGQGLQFNTPDQYHETDVGGEVSYGVNARIDVKGEYDNKRYDNHHSITRARDLDTEGGGIQFSYPVAPKTSVAIEARFKHFNYKLLTSTFDIDSNEQRYFAGLDWEATAKTTGTVRVGYLRKNFLNPRLIDDSFFGWEIAVLWEPLSYSSWNLSTSSMPIETDGTGDFTKDTSVNLTWDHAWSTYLSHHASVGYSRDIFKGSVPVERIDNITTAAFGLDYQFQRWLSIGTEYNYTNRSSNALNASYHQNVWFFRVQGTL